MDYHIIMALLLLAAGVNVAAAAKILLLPFDHKGHVNFFSVAGKELQSRGHQVLLLAQQRNKHIVDGYSIPYLLNEGSNETPAEDNSKINSLLTASGLDQFRKMITVLGGLTDSALEMCRQVLTNEKTMAFLKEENFDIALVDGIDPARCLYVISYKLGIKHITLTARQDPWAAGLPALPSVEGFFGMFIMKKDSSYVQILKNLGIYLTTYIMSPPPPYTDAQISEWAPEKPTTTYADLFRASELFLINFDNTCVDYPRVEAPHYRFIGAMAASQGKQLAKEFDDFVSGASDGLIVVSFGSLVKQAPRDLVEKMLVVFSKLKQRVVMRYDGEMEGVPSNVMLAKWLPQNDLLAHAHTRLFIAHGGNNGQMEAMYHGVPMIVMPFFGDQMYSAHRVVDKKFGLTVNPTAFTVAELEQAVQEVLTNPIYTDNMKKCSAISREFPSAHENIDFWVRHVLRFGGGGHLKPVSMEMPLYRVFMLDVLFIVLVVTVLISYVLYACCRCVCRRCRRREEKVKTN